MQPDFHLTPEESVLVTNSSWLITKQRVVGKVYGLFGALSDKFSGILADYNEFIPAEITGVSPKIYKGEMYRQLPYVMLDNPRFFNQEDVFAIRAFFWWGNHFSLHLLLSGKYRMQFEASLRSHLTQGALDRWYFGVSEDPWEHHFEEDNYQQIQHLKNHSTMETAGPYLKIANMHPLDEWKDAYSYYIDSYTHLLECMVE
jgi:hypothetical protein